MLLPRLGFKKTFESVSDAQRQRESRRWVTGAEMEDAGAGRAMFGFLGCAEACAMGKWTLGTLLLLLGSRLNHPPSVELPLVAVLGLGGSSFFCFLFPFLGHAALVTSSEIETGTVKCVVLQGGCSKAPGPSRLRTGKPRR